MSQWQTKSSKVVYENPWMIVREDEVVMPSGKDGLYGVVSSKSDAVFVVPVDTDGNTYIVQQEHYTTRELSWQCVAGRTDGESADIAAKRELLEEAGVRADTITIIADTRTATGITTFRSSICLAEDLSEDMSNFDTNEISRVEKIPLRSVVEKILNGEIAATESIAAFMSTIAYLDRRDKAHE